MNVIRNIKISYYSFKRTKSCNA